MGKSGLPLHGSGLGQGQKRKIIRFKPVFFFGRVLSQAGEKTYLNFLGCFGLAPVYHMPSGDEVELAVFFTRDEAKAIFGTTIGEGRLNGNDIGFEGFGDADDGILGLGVNAKEEKYNQYLKAL